MSCKTWLIAISGAFALPSASLAAGLAPADFNAMYRFASEGKFKVLSEAVSRGMDIDSVNRAGDTGLCVAIRQQDLTAYKIFKGLGASVSHRCLNRIPTADYNAFAMTVNNQNAARAASSPSFSTNASVRNYSNAEELSYRQDYGGYNPYQVSRPLGSYVTYRPEDEPLISSNTWWTIGGVALIGGGIAYALAEGSDDDDDEAEREEENRLQSILSGLHGVGGAPYVVSGNIRKSIIEHPDGMQSEYWAVYAPENKDIVNRRDITVENVTPNSADSLDHWGAIYSTNGYVYNSGDITVFSGMKYAKGIMSCVLDVYNPNNTSCLVNAANPVAGDIYNEGNIKISGEQSMGIFSSSINRITNNGRIDMVGNDNTGVWVLGNGDVYNNGVITMNGSRTGYLAGSMAGVWVAEEGNIHNTGTIDIAASGRGGNGVYVKKGSVTNSGKINLSGGGIGVEINEGTVTNTGTVAVVGVPSVSTTYGIKVDASGSVENKGVVRIDGDSYVGIGIHNASGDVLNDTDAQIYVNNNSGNSGKAISASGTATNKGVIEVNYGTGINATNVINSGSVRVNGIGIFSENNGENSGTITVTGNASAMQTATGSLTNSGIINSLNVGMLSDSGSVSNTGTIKSSGAALKSKSGNLSNSGSISVDGTSILDGAALVTSTGSIDNSGEIVSRLIGIKGVNYLDTSKEKPEYLPASISVNNTSNITVKDGQYGVYVEAGPTPLNEDGSASDKLESSLTFTNSGTLTIDNVSKAIANAVYASDNGNLTNSGKIIIDNENNSVGQIYGMYAGKGTLTNSSGSNITINAYDANKDGSGTIVGMSVGEGSATNDGTITINANNAVAMRATYIPTAEEEEAWEEGTIKSQVINNGLIYLNGENNIGLQAIGKGAAITNRGTVEIKLPNITEVYRKEGDEVNVPDANKFISLEQGAFYVNSGTTTSETALNFDTLGDGKVMLSKGGVFVAPELSGTVYADSSIVAGGTQDTYVSENAFQGESRNINIKSASYMFDAGLNSQENGQADVVMNRKNFKTITDNSSAALFLENNYVAGNNVQMFDGLKSISGRTGFNSAVSRELGLDLFPNFAKQNFDMAKSLNRNMAETIFSNKSDQAVRATTGYDYLYRTQDDTAKLSGYKDKMHSVYGVVDKKYDNHLRYGMGASFSKLKSDYDNNARRDEKAIQIFTPIMYQNHDSRFISMPRIGYGWGDYRRFVDGYGYSADTENFYYGVSNELRHDIDFGFMVFEPVVEFNVLGLYQNKMHEDEKLRIDSVNNLSVEAGLGLYAKRQFVFDDNNQLRLRIGGSVYHEFADPYHDMTAQMFGMSGDYSLNSYKVQRNRAIFNARVDYQYFNLNFYSQFIRYFEDNGGYEVNTGLDYRF